jgi:NAD(P)H dehydrogenase (quinone)
VERARLSDEHAHRLRPHSKQYGRADAQFPRSDRTLWAKGSLIGKIGSVFASTGTQHGGQETALTSLHTSLLHQGVVIVGVPCSESGLVHMGDITGGTPYGASTMAGSVGSRQPSENELKIARYQEKHVAELATKLFR